MTVTSFFVAFLSYYKNPHTICDANFLADHGYHLNATAEA